MFYKFECCGKVFDENVIYEKLREQGIVKFVKLQNARPTTFYFCPACGQLNYFFKNNLIKRSIIRKYKK